MDPLTHTLLGATLGYAAFGRRLERAAALAGGLAAFAPDVDAFIRSATDPLLAIEHHRGFTHSFAFAPIGAAVVATLWLVRPAWRDRSRWGWLWLCCLLGYLSHALLDASTTYGTQLLWPFSRHRAGWDLIAIIDPLFTLILALALVTALVRQRMPPAAVGLMACGGYIAWGGVQHARAAEAHRHLAAARGHVIERHEIMPTLGNNLVWRALYLHAGRIHSDRIRVGWFSAPTIREGWSLPMLRAPDLLPAERSRNARQSFERFAWFCDGWVARSPADPGLLADMRYSLSAEAFDPIWGLRFTPSGAPTEVTWINRSRDRRVDPRALWAEIAGDDARFHALRLRTAATPP